MKNIMMFTVLFFLLLNKAYGFDFFTKENSNNKEAGELVLKGQNEKAKAIIEKEIKKHPKSGELLYNLGSIYQKDKEYEKAVESYEKALGKAKTRELRSKIFHNMGNSFADTKKYKESLDFYIKSMKELPTRKTASNIEVTKRLLEMQKQQEKKQQNQDQDKNKDKKDKQDQSKQDQQKNQQNEENKKDGEDQHQENEDKKDKEIDKQKSEKEKSKEEKDKKDKKEAAAAQKDDKKGEKRDAEKMLNKFKDRKKLQVPQFMIQKKGNSDNDGQVW